VTSKSFLFFTYWTNIETSIVFGRNFTGQSQVLELCYLYSNPVLFLSVFMCKRQTVNNGILTYLNGIACLCADAAEMYPNNYLHISMALYLKGGNRSWDHKDIFPSLMICNRYKQDDGALNPFHWPYQNKLQLDIFPLLYSKATHTWAIGSHCSPKGLSQEPKS
jgi:hypothetical protein